MRPMTTLHFNIETIGIDRIAAQRALAMGEQNCRPSPRRAQSGLSLTPPDATDINEPNEARA
jgi:hypothetical protein